MKATLALEVLAVLALCAGLAACGGDSSDEPAPAVASEVPASATVSSRITSDKPSAGRLPSRSR